MNLDHVGGIFLKNLNKLTRWMANIPILMANINSEVTEEVTCTI
jgi:hypothetical protein